ncbi:MAG TPA: type II secretion system F family protein [Anaerolineae bacterium]|nr:type II secretion system F family protein [Anaerolineae bacterium]
MTIPFAFLAAFGVFLFVDALRPRRVRVKLTEADNRPAMQRLIESLFAPAAERVMTIGRGTLRVDTQKADLHVRLARAGYPSGFTTPEQVFGARLFNAVMFAVMVGAFALLIGLAEAALPLMLVAGLLGWGVPSRIVAKAEQERKEQLMLDAASTMDRLAIYVASGAALPSAIRSLAERPGGAWVAEYRKVASAYAVNGDLAAAFDETAQKAGRLPEIVRVFERLKAAYEMGGGGMARALRQMAGDARITTRLLITERGYKNAVLMVIPAFFAIIAITIILIAPGAVKMLGVLGR